jgi:hypothetical protein
MNVRWKLVIIIIAPTIAWTAMKLVRRKHADADEVDEGDDCVESHVIKYDGVF